MNAEMLKAVVAQMRNHVKALAPRDIFLTAERADPEVMFVPRPKRLDHVLYMCDQMEKFADEGRMKKAMRWLGFADVVIAEVEGNHLRHFSREIGKSLDPMYRFGIMTGAMWVQGVPIKELKQLSLHLEDA